MDYEKKYKEALKDMRVIYPNLKGDAKLAAEHAFPELAESEDERIRKWIRKEIEDKYVVEGIVNNKLADEAFGWLEKQKHLYETTKDRFYSEGFEEGQLYERQKESLHIHETCKENANSFTDEDERMRKGLIHHLKELREWKAGTMSPIKVKEHYDVWIAYLEKQKEQKPAEWSEEDDALLKEIVSFFKDGTVKLQHDLDLYAGFLENKFKSLRPVKQEWSEEDENKLYQVVETLLADKTITLRENPHCKALHRAYDELIDWLKSLPKRFNLQPKQEWSEDFEDNIRNLLHDKLTWHSEDGSMSTTVFIDNKTLKDIVSGIWFYVGKETLKYPNKEIHVSEWSEEDTEMYINVASSLRGYACGLENEEHKKHIQKGLDWLENRFKSLHPQPHWKPSEEQMNFLLAVINDPNNIGAESCYMTIKSLYNDLKKL